MRFLHHLSYAGGSYYFWRTLPDGTRQISWRVWVLTWVAPVLFLLAAGLLALQTLAFMAGAEKVTGTVVRVYEWDGWTLMEGDVPVYSPVFEYTWTDGEKTQASNGMSAHVWNFPIGSEHQIWAKTGSKGNVMLDRFDRMWGVAAIVGVIGLAVTLPAVIVTFFLFRWLRNAKPTEAST